MTEVVGTALAFQSPTEVHKNARLTLTLTPTLPWLA